MTMRIWMMMMAMGLALTGCGGPGEPAPRLEVDEPTHEFGRQHNRQTLEHTFVLRNDGDAPLRILEIKSTCGCTVGALSDDVIEPGAEATLLTRYNLRGRRGPEDSALVLRTNDPDRPEFSLHMRGEAVEYLRVTPDFLFYNEVVAGQSVTRHIEIKGRPREPFEILSATVPEGRFAVQSVEVLEAHHYRVSVLFEAPEAPGLSQGVLEIETTHPVYPELTFPITAQVPGPLEVVPTSIQLLTGVDTPLTRFIVVRPGKVREFEVTGVETPHAGIEVAVDPMPNGSHRIRLSNLVALEELEGTALVIRTDAEEMPEIRVPILLNTPGS